jgi:uncharacterized protein YebE (UPF0316 family)
MNDFIQSQYFTYIVIPFLICLARIVDVSLGTLRIIFVSKGIKKIAPILGFFEILIWLVAIGQVMQNLTNIINYFAYAFGFAIGNYIGIILEQKLAMGTVVVQIITRRDASELINFLRLVDFVLTVIEANGGTGPVHIIFTVTKRSNLPYIIETINNFNPKAFYLVEDIRFVSDAILPAKTFWLKSKFTALIGARKAK